MAITLNEKKRLCEIVGYGPITVLGNINGPIRKCKLTDREILYILKQGFKVFEYNPENPEEEMELNLTTGGASPYVAQEKVEEAPKKKTIAPVVEPIIEPIPEKEEVVEEVPEVVVPEVVEEVPVEVVEETPEVVEEAAPVAEVPVEAEKAPVTPTEKPVHTGSDFNRKNNKKRH